MLLLFSCSLLFGCFDGQNRIWNHPTSLSSQIVHWKYWISVWHAPLAQHLWWHRMSWRATIVHQRSSWAWATQRTSTFGRSDASWARWYVAVCCSLAPITSINGTKLSVRLFWVYMFVLRWLVFPPYRTHCSHVNAKEREREKNCIYVVRLRPLCCFAVLHLLCCVSAHSVQAADYCLFIWFRPWTKSPWLLYKYIFRETYQQHILSTSCIAIAYFVYLHSYYVAKSWIFCI